MSDDVRQSAKVWDADLGEPGRRLTLAELQALEAIHTCAVLTELLEQIRGLVLYGASLEGRLDRIEQYLRRLDPARYPSGPEPYGGPGQLVGGEHGPHP